MQSKASRALARRSPLLRRLRMAVAAAASILLVSAVLVPMAAQADEIPTIHLGMTVSPAPPTALSPGDTATYTYNVECSALTVNCDNFSVTDTIPAPLVLKLVSAPTGVHTTITQSGNTFTVNFVQPLDDGDNGLDAGGQAGFTVTAQVPATGVPASDDGETITNSATATDTNGSDPANASADVLLHIPAIESSSISKTFTVGGATGTSEPIKGAVGATSQVGLSFASTSNVPVTSITVQDPSNTSSTPFYYAGVTGLDGLTFPSGANRVQVDWFDGTQWNDGTPSSTLVVPAPGAGESIEGLRFTFTNSAGNTIGVGASGSLNIDTALTSNVMTIDAQASPATTTVTNVASDFVTVSGVNSTPVTSSASLVISHVLINPVATKSYAQSSIVGGVSDEVTVGGSNSGNYTVTSMTVTEPKSGTPDLVAQGLTFTDWDAPNIEWPVGATSLSFRYLYDGADPGYGTATVITSSAGDNTLPEPAPAAGQSVAGFQAVFTGTMAPSQYTKLPFTFATQAVNSDTTETNTISFGVVTDDGQTASATASADLTLRTARINTSVSKTATPSKIYSVGGASTVISLPAQVDPLPTSESDTGGSTVGADELDVQDPADPATDSFWDDFNVGSIVQTDIPSGVTMSVKYWDGSAWQPLTGAQGIAGGVTFSYTLTPAQQDAAEGLQFDFIPVSGTLAPGFAVQPNIKAVLRTDLRSDPTTAPNPSTTVTVDVDNTVLATATSKSTIPGTVTATNDAEVHLLPVDPGKGITMIAKEWLPDPVTGDTAVDARSTEQRTAAVTWGTGSQSFTSVIISDSSEDPSTTPVSDTVYDAFNLVSIPAITAKMDPLLTYDEVQEVDLYIPGTGWVEPATDPCAIGNCDGTFPGYTLTQDESQDATGARLIFVESPTRASRIAGNPSAPEVGSGVAASTDLDREVDFTFTPRAVKRSDSSVPALGTTAGTMYNDSDPGVVDNAARIDGLDSLGSVVATGTAGAKITILDQPIDVVATKTWSDGPTPSPLGVPTDPTTPAEEYPTAEVVLTATNSSVAGVDDLTITDPTGTDDPFDYVDMIGIDQISCPSEFGLGTDTVTLMPSASYPSSYTVAEAEALTTAQLADATGISVDCGGTVAGGSTATVKLNTQLRQDNRATGDPVLPAGSTTETVDNEVTATITDPEVLSNPSHQVSAVKHASIDIDAQSYGVTGTKLISTADTTPAGTIAIQKDGDSPDAQIDLSGQPQGDVPTTQMIISDTTPTFWNAFNLKSIPTPSLVTPINHVEVDVLTGVTYTYSASTTPEITETCAGSSDLTDCWHNVGTNLSSPVLPSGTTLADVRGIRYIFTDIDSSSDILAWERPHNPLQPVDFIATRRTTLITGGSVNDDLYTNTTAAPDETQVGTTTNTVDVTAGGYMLGGTTNSGTPLWTDTDHETAELQYQHIPADVSITKTPTGHLSLGADIPYQIAVTNTGTTGDKILSDVVVTDTIPGDSGEPALVLPSDPDTGNPETPAVAFSYTMTDGATTEPVPNVNAVLGSIDPTTGAEPITFTLTGAQTIPLGWTLTINATLDFRPGLLAGTNVTNTATVVSDQVYDNCNYTTNAVSQPTQTDVSSCTSSTTTIPDPSAPLTIVKGVRGVEAGPLATDGTELLDTNPGDAGFGKPFDDLGVLKTVTTSLNSCQTTNAGLATYGGKGFYTYPCVPITRPGAQEQWESQFTNGGNIPLDKIVAIDVLPTANDTGVIINSSRGSKWTPTLTSYPAIAGLPATASYTVYETSSAGVATARCNGADIQSTMGMTATSTPPILASYISAGCMTTDASDDVPNRTWTVLPDNAADAGLSDAAYAKLLAGVVALKFVVNMGSTGLAPSDSIDITYFSQTANNIDLPETSANLERDSIAYNSIAGAAVGVDPAETPYPFVSEPRKVGVALATGSINLSKLVTGAADGTVAPSTYNFSVACKSNGVPVQIFDSNGNARNPFTVTPGSTVNINGLPLYSQCTVTEPTNYGETVQTLPATTLRAEAAHSTTSEVDNPHPAFDTTTTPVVVSRPAIPTATITNEYDESDFAVTKTINNGGALDKNGNPYVYTSPAFSASCTFNNGTGTAVTTLATTTFTLASGGSKAFTNVPAGSVCTVTETDTELASSTSYAISANGASVSNGTTSTTTFTVAPKAVGTTGATNTVAFTNSYTDGSLAVNKVLAGDTTWSSNRTFSFSVTCTYKNAEAVATTDYSGTFTLTSGTPSNLTKTINNIPTGSTCAVTETGKAGATATAITGNNAVIGNGTTKTVTVTNTYSDATLTVSKVVHTNGAKDAEGNVIYPTFAYPMSVVCSFQGANVWGTGFTASPMTFSLTQGTSKAIAGLPAGASCVTTETDPHGADSESIVVQSSTAGSSVSTPGTTSSALILTKDGTGAVGTNTAIVNNNYGVTSFTVSKALAGGGAAQFAAASFTIDVTCTEPDSTVSDTVITLPTAGGAWTQTISSLPEDTVCSAVEQNLSSTGADAQSFVDSDGSVTGLGVPATLATPGSVAITNWYLTGSIVVSKQVTGDAAAAYGSKAGQFTVELDCTRYNTNNVKTVVSIPGGSSRTIAAGGSTTFNDLPTGAQCSLSETNVGGATSTEILAGTSVVSTGTTYTAITPIATDNTDLTDNQPQQGFTVQNTFLPASLNVTKYVAGAAIYHNGSTDTDVSYGPFPVEVQCDFDGASVYDQTKSITEGDTWNIPNLVAGASCDITETDTMSAAATKIVTTTGTDPAVTTNTANATGVVLAADDGGTANSAAITNTYQTGTLVLSKVVSGTGAADWGQGPFTLVVSCSLTDESGTRQTLDESYQVTGSTPAISIADVAAGSDCTVTETKTVGANSTSITFDGGTPSVETTADFTSPTATSMAIGVTNRFDEAEVDVTKNRDGAGASLYGAGPFEVSLACTRPIDGLNTAFTVPGGPTRALATPTYKATYTGLPAGATCQATETKTGGATSTTIFPGTFVTDTSLNTDLEITNTFDEGSLSVTKTITGAGAALYGAGPFEVSLTCTRLVDGTTTPVLIPGGATRELTDLASYEATYDQLPTGATCTITETKTHGATSSTWTSPTTVVIGDGTTVATTLTNEFDIGFVTVNNLVTGNDAKHHSKDTFDVVLSCTEDIDGVETPIDIPGGATRDIWDKTSITYDDLPIGASCGLVESVTNNAQTVTVMWHGMPVPANTVVIGDPDYTINVVNVFNIVLAYTGENVMLQLILGLLGLLAGAIIMAVTVIRRRREERDAT